ncbi:ribosome hibernation factor-recruiting GTPase MRF [Gordonia liuliyuniae]|uniref:GTP-binding protein n=1 Tax=Gordonia liuliyuniae TaxID=2911517 RepID=A0ABS9IVJ3_9ACTN|nr:GTP-binding protein [Gordonia liuliyuniae]MCF8589588.1 GTP-binding protein [Gordonia liuliyuniae]
MSDATHRTPVTLVAGLDRTISARIAYTLLSAGTTVVSHDLRDVAAGRVTRVEHRMSLDGVDTLSIDDVDLEHGCVSCTLRLDLLPMLRTLHRDPDVRQIVVLLDPMVEPERLAVEIDSTVVEAPDVAPGPASADVEISATLCGIDARSWLDDATGDATLAEAGVIEEGATEPDDERTLSQIAVAQVRFADAIVIDGADGVESAYDLARLHAVLLRLAPAAGMRTLNSQQALTRAVVDGSIDSMTPGTPHGRPTQPFDPLLAGGPDLDEDCGVQLVSFEADRPFHPERLHDSLDVLLEGVVTARGRMWFASDPDDVMWLESAGGGLSILHVGTWLACVDDHSNIDPAHQVLASLRWDREHGDRHTALTVLCHRADPGDVRRALADALVTDDELARGQDYITSLPSPFGHAHRDPCDDMESPTDRTESSSASRAESRPEGEQL